MKNRRVLMLCILIPICGCRNNGETATIRIDFSNKVPERFGITIGPIHNLEYRKKDLIIDSLGLINTQIDIEKPIYTGDVDFGVYFIYGVPIQFPTFNK